MRNLDSLIGTRFCAESSWKIATPEKYQISLPSVIDIKGRHCTFVDTTDTGDMKFTVTVKLEFDETTDLNFAMSRDSAISMFPLLLGYLDRLKATDPDAIRHETVVASNNLVDAYENAGSY